MRYLFFLLLALCSQVTMAQTRVTFDYVKGSNDLVYPEDEADKLIQPGQHKAIFFGEGGSIYCEPVMKLHLIKHLNGRYGTRDIFMQTGYGTAYLFNKYLATGNAALLNLRITYTTGAYMDMWKALYDYNTTLPADKKLRIHGLDMETRDIMPALLAMKPANKQIPPALRGTFDKIDEAAADSSFPRNHRRFAKLLNEIIIKFTDLHSDLSNYYGEDIAIVDQMIANNQKTGEQQRAASMYTNMLSAIKEDSISSFIAFLGPEFVQHGSAAALPVLLRQNEQYRDKTATIMAVYYNAYDVQDKEIKPSLGFAGTRKKKSGGQIRDKYFNQPARAILITTKGTADERLAGTADHYLLANDRTNP